MALPLSLVSLKWVDASLETYQETLFMIIINQMIAFLLMKIVYASIFVVISTPVVEHTQYQRTIFSSFYLQFLTFKVKLRLSSRRFGSIFGI